MRIAVVGSGGREHAIIWKISQSADVRKIWAIPGNGGTAELAENITVSASDVKLLSDTLLRISPDLVIVGPEIPLASGISDLMAREHIPCFGPTARAARIESSKAFAKSLIRNAGVSTAEFEVFDDFEVLKSYVLARPNPGDWVVKADGLAAGKGVIVCSSVEEVLLAAQALLVEGRFGTAGRQVVLERKLLGLEASCMFWCDGVAFHALPAARDYKRALDGDKGENTGGMGSLCPVLAVTPALQEEIGESIIRPVLRELEREDCTYRGLLYAGLMLTEEGVKVIEFNCRFGDPETQVILPVWKGDLVQCAMECAIGQLSPQMDSSYPVESAVSIVVAAQGYPGKFREGLLLKHPRVGDGQLAFHGGTMRVGNGLQSTGGRVFNAVGIGDSLVSARESAYELAKELCVEGLRYRMDIAAS